MNLTIKEIEFIDSLLADRASGINKAKDDREIEVLIKKGNEMIAELPEFIQDTARNIYSSADGRI